ncbi:hypothetical protein AWB68_03269 [Caballeronia choica]|uniref:Uncharacterized protein n=1 Tax=Caballeronia choica TaxID=326476 RepID=A0A158J1J9_9BURK|nr:hypothetical protein AWB68_03269 [Caballeronia choica]
MSQSLPGFSPLPNHSDCRVVSGPALVAARLLELHSSLDEALLKDVNEHGFRARREATASHPPTAAGTYHWIGSVFALRSNLTLRDWTKQDLRNCPFIVSPDKAVAIAVMTGDSDTGLVAGRPTNQAQKGAVIRQAVANNRQSELFDGTLVSAELARSGEGTQLWILLYHAGVGEDGKEELRAELSFPSRFERKQIVGWRERIVLSAIRPDGETDVRHDVPTAPIDVPVERRTGTA